MITPDPESFKLGEPVKIKSEMGDQEGDTEVGVVLGFDFNERKWIVEVMRPRAEAMQDKYKLHTVL